MRILVVDDAPDNVYLLCRLCKMCGHEAHGAMSGQQALQMAGDQRPDMVLMDLSMPGMDGYEASRRLRDEVGLTAPIYAVTAMDEDKQQLERSGISGYQRKPIGIHDINRLLGC